MSNETVKTLLLLSSADTNCSFSFLFHCAKYWAQQGKRILFISKTPVKCLPLDFGEMETPLNPDAFKLIQFMYLGTCQELLQQLYSIHLRHNPVSMIIVKNIESYFDANTEIESHNDHVSLVCASLLHAALTCAKLINQQTILINDYVSNDLMIERNILKNFFHNIWEIKINKEDNEKSTFKFSKLSAANFNEVVSYTVSENSDELVLIITDIIKRL